MSIFKFLKSKSFLLQIVIAIVGFFILFFVLKFWLNITTNHDQKIQVPNLHKITLDEAERKLKELNLDFKVIDSASYNPTYPKKSVIEQSPEAGDFVKEKRKIYLTLNPSKFRDITIPDLNGRTKRQAESELTAIGFIVGTDYTYVRDIGLDVVRGLRHKGKILNPNDKLPKNSIIELVLGDGER
ncbi:PASTA domain-containing protein [Polaribacter vadi]|uniref:PASTA domain-containing protein n=1 Tax=Polaribacter TaxID=52959 RepID=UPI001C089CB5|nr:MULTISPECIES: PASTA domain-containing protein [Polaribacter]MBU3012906.1 PASTA domain-containing protein [Polaribacter vadi]MDO6742724.1 PASTA domain-containing protein [Polaribacter sp. 1_MG-2023]